MVVLGAGDAAVGLLKELSRSHEWRVVGLLDDDVQKRGRLLQGVRVMGALDDLPRFAARLKLRHAIIAMPSVPYKVRRRVVEICKRAKVTVLTVPTLNNVAGGKLAPPKIRKVAVEDLMKREPVTLDDAGLHELLTGKVVLVTGAGGSIGSELCRQIAALPALDARALRAERVRDVQGRRGAARGLPGHAGGERGGRREERAARDPGDAPVLALASSSTRRPTSTCR